MEQVISFARGVPAPECLAEEELADCARTSSAVSPVQTVPISHSSRSIGVAEKRSTSTSIPAPEKNDRHSCSV